MRFEFTFGEGRLPTPRDPEAPFRVLVLGDFSGRGGRRPPVSERGPARVDIDTIESFLELQKAEVDLEASGAAALRVAPKTLHLPWHRVVAAGGRIAFPRSSRQYHEQARRLRAEGVRVTEGRVERRSLTELV